jgi:hypothetical protein
MLSVFSYTIEFLPGDSNVWADLMTRWGAPDVVPTLVARRIRGIFRAPIAPSLTLNLNGQMSRPLGLHKKVLPARLPLGSKPANQTRLLHRHLVPLGFLSMPSSFSYACVFWLILVPVAIAVSQALSLLYLRISFGLR